MSKYDFLKNIRLEIQRLNREIDLKIIKGVSYRRESRRHRFLLNQLSKLSKPKKVYSWIEIASQAISMFIL